MSGNERDSLITEIIASSHFHDFYGAKTEEVVRTNLHGFSDSTLNLIRAAAEWKQGAGDARARYDCAMFMKNAFIELKENVLREVMLFCPKLDFHVHLIGVMQLAHGLRMLDLYEDSTDFTCLDGEELWVAEALFDVTAAISEYSTQGQLQLTTKTHRSRTALFLNDLELQELITTNHHRSDDIVTVIRERGSSDADTIRECLGNGTVLVSGVL